VTCKLRHLENLSLDRNWLACDTERQAGTLLQTRTSSGCCSTRARCLPYRLLSLTCCTPNAYRLCSLSTTPLRRFTTAVLLIQISVFYW